MPVTVAPLFQQVLVCNPYSSVSSEAFTCEVLIEFFSFRSFEVVDTWGLKELCLSEFLDGFSYVKL